ncbi:TetR/AcrR family transcriptional regulator [Cupriavidus sp. SK-4]|uniref:TetR/AcrR family transcriptional regulator n=1 Tax=Cupriavidus sp. SK-4 TaxID=574750 RepID=UPI000A02BBF3|nr:TetR/AcrR family transcriptional regulator [Cupriavidus sp. SK-4]
MTAMTPHTARTRRTQEERRATSELALINAAMTVMRAKGVGGMTIAEVAETAGVSKGLVVHLYGNKQALQLAVLTELRTDFAKRFQQAEGHTVGLERLRSFIRAHFGSLSKPDSNTQVFSALLSEAIFQDQEFAADVASMNDATIAFVRECLEAEQSRGTRFIESDLDSLATFIVASMRGIAQVFSINATAKTKTLDTQKVMHLCETMVDRMVVSA